MLIEKRPEQIKEMSAGVVENLDIFVETVHKDTQANGKTTERSAEFKSAVACTLAVQEAVEGRLTPMLVDTEGTRLA